MLSAVLTHIHIFLQASPGSGKNRLLSYFSKYDIIKDLNLDIIFRTMSRGDVLVSENINKIMMLPLKTPE
jgi:hypothetical protein